MERYVLLFYVDRYHFRYVDYIDRPYRRSQSLATPTVWVLIDRSRAHDLEQRRGVREINFTGSILLGRSNWVQYSCIE